MFVHEPFDIAELESETGADGRRHYVTPSGNQYPSVTTMLSDISDKTFLDEWKARIGEELANVKTRYAASRGTRLHEALEKFLNNESVDYLREDYMIWELFLKFKSALEVNVDKVCNQEFCIYSDKLKLAGRSDLLGYWNGVLSIIDFKTADKPKHKDWIKSYFLQCTIYAMALWEIYQIPVKKIVVIIGNEQDVNPQIFEEDTLTYVKEVLKICREYNSEKTNG